MKSINIERTYNVLLNNIIFTGLFFNSHVTFYLKPNLKYLLEKRPLIGRYIFS